MTRRQFLQKSAKTGFSLGIASGFAEKNIFAPPARFDIIVKNGLIMDGVQDEGKSLDLGVVTDRIETVADLSPSLARTVIDAKGKIVSPGFIDIHSHTDYELLMNPRAESKIRQGITTELNGNCGGSAFPHKKKLSVYEKSIKDTTGMEFLAWTDFAGYRSILEKRGISVNYGTLVGHGTIRQHVIGHTRRKPTLQEMRSMQEHVHRAMRQGAFGLSTGLEYAPDRFAHTEEIIEICRAAAQHGGFYATHMRSEDTQLIEAVAEAIHIAETACLPLQLSHLKVAGKRNYYKLPMVFDLMERAEERGLDITADRYPYTAYATSLSIMFPSWALDGGSSQFVERLKSKEIRVRMKEEALEKAEGNNSWESMMVVSASQQKNKPLIGKDLQTAADEKKQHPYEFVCDLLISEGGHVSIIGFGMSEENTTRILIHPQVMLCTDGVALAPYGKLGGRIPHPRNYGSFPRFLGRYIREEKHLGLPRAIRKMTSQPAQKMGLKKRGVLAKGNYADITVFDPLTIMDTATFIKPRQYSYGIDHVIVNGKVVIAEGDHTGALPGKILFGPGKT